MYKATEIVAVLFAGRAAPTLGVTPVLGLYKVEGSLGVSAAGAAVGVDLALAGLGDN